MTAIDRPKPSRFRRWTQLLLGIGTLALRTHAAPIVQTAQVTPNPLVVGQPLSLSFATSADVVQATATVDLRPWAPRVLRVVLALSGGRWNGTATLPHDLVPPQGAKATIKTLFFDAARARTEHLLSIPVVAQEPITAVFDPGSGVLTVTGTDSDNHITVGRQPAGNLRVNGGTVPILGGVPTIANTTLVRILGLGGSDQLRVDETAGPMPPAALDGGPGNDLLVGGGSDDEFTWKPGDGSDTLEGRAGFNSLVFTGSNANETITLSANGTRFRLLRDIGNVLIDANEVQGLVLHALAGTDSISVGDLAGTHVTRVHLALGNSIAGGTSDGQPDSVFVSGTGNDDIIAVRDSGPAIQVQGLQGMLAEITIQDADPAQDKLLVSGQTGDDVLDGTNLSPARIGLFLEGNQGSDVLLGSNGDDLLSGGPGEDILLGNAGDDTFVWNPGDGSDLLEGQAGRDTLVFNGANVGENIEISRNGGRVRFFRNVGNVTQDANDVEAVRFLALGGADQILVQDVSGTDLTEITVDLASANGTGDGQADAVTVQGTNADDVILAVGNSTQTTVLGLSAQINILNAEASLDTLRINSLAGDDIIECSGLAANAIGLRADGGNDNDVLVGGDGNDVLIGGPGDDVLIGGPGVDVLDGGTGDNVVIQ